MPTHARNLWVLALLLAPATATGYIERMYSLEEFLKESTNVCAGRLIRVDRKAKTAVAVVDRALKGKLEFKKVLMNVALGPAHHGQYVIERLNPGGAVLLFYKRTGNSLLAVCHAGDIYFQLHANDIPKDRAKVWWRLAHMEIRLGRTFNGSTAQFVKLVDDVVAQRVEPPKPDPNVPPLNMDRLARAVAIAMPKGKTGGFYRQTQFQHAGGKEIRGISWTDVNADGRLDIFLCRQLGNVLLINRPTGFHDDASRVGIVGGSRSAAWADYDADGRADLLTGGFQLFANAGGLVRNDAARLPAPKDHRRPAQGAGWIDYNADGRPDALITTAHLGVRLYANAGTGPKWFGDVSDQAGLGAKGLGRGRGGYLACFDYDADGYADFLYNLGDGVLARNQGDGTFRPAADSGIKLAGGAAYSRGVAVADFDNDGDLDLFIPGPARAQLYRNNNDGTFTDVMDDAADLAKVKDPSFAAAWGDVNADGFVDLFVCHPGRPCRMYLGNGRGQFTDVSGPIGVKTLVGALAASFADLDGDGDLDLVVNLPNRMVVATNAIGRPKTCGTLTVHPKVRAGLVGATIRVLDDTGRPVGLRELNGAEGCGGQACPVGHFGLRTGRYFVAVCLSDGRAAETSVQITSKTTRLVLEEKAFE